MKILTILISFGYGFIVSVWIELQIPTEELVRKGFDISPSNVLGVLIGFAFIIIISLVYALIKVHKQWQDSNKNTTDLIIKNVEAYKDLTSVIGALKTVIEHKE